QTRRTLLLLHLSPITTPPSSPPLIFLLLLLFLLPLLLLLLLLLPLIEAHVVLVHLHLPILLQLAPLGEGRGGGMFPSTTAPFLPTTL
ncbi:unnamed protein product, partial [Closterium sp. NIES-53]